MINILYESMLVKFNTQSQLHNEWKWSLLIEDWQYGWNYIHGWKLLSSSIWLNFNHMD